MNQYLTFGANNDEAPVPINRLARLVFETRIALTQSFSIEPVEVSIIISTPETTEISTEAPTTMKTEARTTESSEVPETEATTTVSMTTETPIITTDTEAAEGELMDWGSGEEGDCNTNLNMIMHNYLTCMLLLIFFF